MLLQIKKRSIDKIHRALEWNEKVDNKPGEYGKNFMKIKFDADVNLSLNKILKLHRLTIVVRSFFKKTKSIIHNLFRWIST